MYKFQNFIEYYLKINHKITFILELLSKGLRLIIPNLVKFFKVSNKIVQTNFKDDTIYYI